MDDPKGWEFPGQAEAAEGESGDLPAWSVTSSPQSWKVLILSFTLGM